jgi:hypothetical protein
VGAEARANAIGGRMSGDETFLLSRPSTPVKPTMQTDAFDMNGIGHVPCSRKEFFKDWVEEVSSTWSEV